MSDPLKGRGAAFNPLNRFDRILVEDDPEWDPAQNPKLPTQHFRDGTKSIITYNDSEDVGFAASVNPYRGCEHGCVYCYARPGHEYFGLSCGLDFESKIFVKEKAPELLRVELKKEKYAPQVLIMSGITDPYQPVERRLQITRRCLRVLADFRNPAAVITKNALVTRDLDLFKELNEYRGCAVNISVTSLNKDIARKMEPRASSPEDRLKAVGLLSRAGIPVRVMVAPVVPALTDEEIPRILKAASEAGARQAAYVMLRLPWAVKDLFTRWLEENFPDRKSKIISRIRDLRGGKLYDSTPGARMRGEGVFAAHVGQLFDVNRRKYRLNKTIALSCDHFRRDPGQMQFPLSAS